MRGPLWIGAVALALAGCADREAGGDLGGGTFGQANAAVLAAQTGRGAAVRDLGGRFAREVPDTVTFAFDSATLDAAARATLDRQAAWIARFPEVRFRVYGHTDLVGSAAYNRALGLARAQAVVDHLAARGIGRDRLEAVVSHGQTRPVVRTAGPERRNRRTVTEVSGLVARHPTVMDGEYARIVRRGYLDSGARPLPPVSITARAF